MSRKKNNRFENWSEADVTKYIQLKEEIASQTSALGVGLILGVAFLFSGACDDVGGILLVSLMVGVGLYTGSCIKKAKKQADQIAEQNAPWPP